MMHYKIVYISDVYLMLPTNTDYGRHHMLSYYLKPNSILTFLFIYI